MKDGFAIWSSKLSDGRFGGLDLKITDGGFSGLGHQIGAVSVRVGGIESAPRQSYAAKASDPFNASS